jgi:cell division protein FtsB
MREFQERHKVKKRLYSKTTLAVLLGIMILTARGAYSVYQKDQESGAALAVSESQEEALASRAVSIQQDSSRLQTTSGVEEEIRDKFDVAKPGEQVIVIVDATNSVSTTTTKGFMQSFWDSVMGVFGRHKNASSSIISTSSE